jgi:hypothetical protein
MRDAVAVKSKWIWTKLMRRATAGAVIAVAVMALSGCRVFVKEPPPPCPRVSILTDASKLVMFRPGDGRDVTDVELQAEISRYHGSCFYDKNERVMTLKLQVGIDAKRGPALVGGDKRDLNYFIAIANFYPQDAGKKIMPVTLEFSKNAKQVRLTDNDVEISFPVKNVKELEPYEVFLGFQLDDAQLDYNRRHQTH